jgi:hypothetical protein
MRGDLVTDTLASPLEDFMRSYLEGTGGVWDEIEPQVYDVLVPPVDGAGVDGEQLRVAFDPEALPEHPEAQLASFGTPFIDRLLHDALRRGRSGLAYVVGLHLAPHDLAARCRRALELPAPLSLELGRARALHFTQGVFWFQAEFISDRKEQDIVPVAVDLHHGREVRHLDELLDHSRLADQPAQPLPDARRLSSPAAYRLARAQVLRTITGLAHARRRELNERLDHQVARLRQYYGDLRGEQSAQAQRSRDAAEAAARLTERRAALEREERLRIAELQQKSALRVHLRLLQLLLIQQPKLLMQAQATAPARAPIPLELVWDPLIETLEAPTCPGCGHPSYRLELNRQGQLVCPTCRSSASDTQAKSRGR